MSETVLNDGVTGPDAPDAKPVDKNPEGETLLAGKFKTPEDLERAYKELEQKLGKPEEEGKVGSEPTPEEAAKATAEEATKALEVAGLDMTKYVDEFSRTGQLSEESYKELAEKGFSKEVVDTFAQGQMASKKLMEDQVDALMNEVGGAEQFAKIQEWAINNLSEEEITAYNDAIDTGKPHIARMALNNLKAAYEGVVGKAPNLVAGKAKAPSQDVFRSNAEVVEAMRDPRYHNDPAYIEEVAKKIARSNVL